MAASKPHQGNGSIDAASGIFLLTKANKLRYITQVTATRFWAAPGRPGGGKMVFEKRSN
jgi:hypothetical protein